MINRIDRIDRIHGIGRMDRIHRIGRIDMDRIGRID